MGRNRYTPQERNKITATFIRCTREIIDLEGIQQVSIRKVAQTAGLTALLCISILMTRMS